MEAVDEYGGLNLGQSRAIADAGAGYTEFDDGDVVVAKITPCFENGKGALAVGLVNGAAFGTTELHVLRPGQGMERRFLFYFSISWPYRSTGEGAMYGAGGQKRVPPEFCKDVAIPLPAIAEQHTIADFLDRETAKIDTLVAKKRTLIERLKEKRTALISRTVTKGLPPDAARAAGLDPHPKFKPSGIDWLGDVPEHWVLKPVKSVATIGNGSTPSRENEAYWDGGHFPWLTSSVANEEVVMAAEEYVTDLALAACHLPRIRPPAVLVGITGQGRTRGMATTLVIEATLNQHLAFVKPLHAQFDCGFLRRVFDKAYGYLRSESDGGGSTKGAITCEQIGQLRMPVPPFPEQRAIASFLDRETRTLDAMVAKIATAIARLHEYRTSLITAAVTGKIDVRPASSMLGEPAFAEAVG